MCSDCEEERDEEEEVSYPSAVELAHLSANARRILGGTQRPVLHSPDSETHCTCDTCESTGYYAIIPISVDA